MDYEQTNRVLPNEGTQLSGEMKFCRNILDELLLEKYGKDSSEKVMDLRAIELNLKNNKYQNVFEFAADVKSVFFNLIRTSQTRSIVQFTQRMEAMFDQRIALVLLGQNTNPELEVMLPHSHLMLQCVEIINELLLPKNFDYYQHFSHFGNSSILNLLTIKSKLSNFVYKTIDEFAVDVRLLFSIYHRLRTPNMKLVENVHKLKDLFEMRFAHVMSISNRNGSIDLGYLNFDSNSRQDWTSNISTLHSLRSQIDCINEALSKRKELPEIVNQSSATRNDLFTVNNSNEFCQCEKIHDQTPSESDIQYEIVKNNEDLFGTGQSEPITLRIKFRKIVANIGMDSGENSIPIIQNENRPK